MLGRGETMYASISASPGDMPASWNVVVGVAALADAEARASELGAQVLMSGMQVPGGRASAIADPVAGSTIILFETSDASAGQ